MSILLRLHQVSYRHTKHRVSEVALVRLVALLQFEVMGVGIQACRM